MSFTRTQMIANVREMMDAASSARWTDAFITTVLGIVHQREWKLILNVNPYYRYQQVAVTPSAAGIFAYSSLTTGTGNSVKNLNRIISVTDGSQTVYEEASIGEEPLATAGSGALLSRPRWMDIGPSVQILPAAATALTVSVNWWPCRIDTVDFPDGNESVVWLETGGELLGKGGTAEQRDRSISLKEAAGLQRQLMYADLTRRSTRPTFFAFSDGASDWSG